MTEPQPPKPADCWSAYAPTKEIPWDLRRVVHLHRRAGFAATWAEIQRDLKDGPKASIGRLLAGKARVDGPPTDFEATAALLAESAIRDTQLSRLKAWYESLGRSPQDLLAQEIVHNWEAAPAKRAA